MTVTRLTGDALETIRTLPDASVDLVACSPPFLALRNYNDLDGQWGSEPDPAAFLDNLLALTVEIRRTLTPHGSIAFELGDTFSGKSGWGDDDGNDRYPTGRGVSSSSTKPNASGPGWPLTKSLCGIPTLFAWSLAYGRNLLNPAHTLDPWRVRNLIVWARNNPPVGALGDKVRPATSYVTVATVATDRWFDLDAVRTPHSEPGRSHRRDVLNRDAPGYHTGNDSEARPIQNPNGAPPLDHWHDEYDGDLTWLINTQGSGLAHYAMWPSALAERLILSMCPAEVCRSCRKPRRRIVAKNRPVPADDSQRRKHANGERPHAGRQDRPPEVGWEIERETTGWTDCGHDDYRPGVVLDPFAGTGTTLAVADIHDRDAIGIDLDPANHDLYERRYAECWRSLGRNGTSPVTEHGEQLDMFNGP